MAHIFKKFSKDNKGIIVFTHKELGFMNALPANINNYYYIGVHYGSATHIHGVEKHKYQDFCMGTESTVKFIGESPLRIPFNSRGFLSKNLSKDNRVHKYWDIINVSRNAHVKRLDQFLMSIRKLYDSGYNSKVLLVVPSGDNETPQTHHTDIVEQYDKLFSREEKDNFTLLRLSKELGFLGISPSTIEYLYKSSKIFNLMSSAEGESRVIHEALLCGLPVVCFAGLLGGGRDYLNEKNSVYFKDYDKIHESFITALNNYDNFDVNSEKLAEELREDKTIPKLKKYFRELYSKDGKEFDGELINTDELCLRLPGHYLDVPWNTEFSKNRTADIINIEQLKKSLRLGRDLSWARSFASQLRP